MKLLVIIVIEIIRERVIEAKTNLGLGSSDLPLGCGTVDPLPHRGLDAAHALLAAVYSLSHGILDAGHTRLATSCQCVPG